MVFLLSTDGIWMRKGYRWKGAGRNVARSFVISDSRSINMIYHIQSDNLELVTIVECVSAAGDVVLPLLCLQNIVFEG